jgi:hypothetical protein
MNLRTIACALLFAMPLFGVGCGDTADLNAAPQAKAGCEEPTAEMLKASDAMLPGRNCMTCHAAGQQAADKILGTGGTVYGAKNSKTCNTGGVADVKVDILDTAGNVIASTMTNSVGNFHFPTNAAFKNATARVRKGTMSLKMTGAVDLTTGCASCHFASGLAADRIYIQ